MISKSPWTDPLFIMCVIVVMVAVADLAYECSADTLPPYPKGFNAPDVDNPGVEYRCYTLDEQRVLAAGYATGYQCSRTTAKLNDLIVTQEKEIVLLEELLSVERDRAAEYEQHAQALEEILTEAQQAVQAGQAKSVMKTVTIVVLGVAVCVAGGALIGVQINE